MIKPDYKAVVEFWGEDNQINQTIEEMAELIKELNKFRRNCSYMQAKDTYNAFRGNVLEEMADVYNMLAQLNVIFGVTIRENDEYMSRSVKKMNGRIQSERIKRRQIEARLKGEIL